MDNETNTAQLTNDLENARKQVSFTFLLHLFSRSHESYLKNQVKDLQDRLSHMEMIFLQQALGVASEQLPNDVIRSISVHDTALSNRLLREVTEESASGLYKEDDEEKAENSGENKPVSSNSPLRFGEIDQDDDEAVDAATVMKAMNLAQQTQQQPESGNGTEFVSHTPDEALTIAVSRELSQAMRLSEILTVASPSLEKSRSEVDLSKLSAPSRTLIEMSSGESLLDNFNPNDLSQQSAAWVQTLISTSDRVISSIQPNYESVKNRFQVFVYVRELIAKTVGAQLFPVGSFVSRTFLPEGDIDATAFVPKLGDDSWFVKINEALCIAAYQGGKATTTGGDAVSVSNVSFVNTEIKMIRSMINGISVDISTNQLPSLFADSLLERIDGFVKRKHLFKRSLLLVKAWFNYESPRFTHGGGTLYNSRDSKINSWVLAVMLIWTFNVKGKAIYSPLQALAHFFRLFSTFNWQTNALTVHGPVPIDSLTGDDSQNNAFSASSNNFFPQSLFDFTIPDDPRFSKPLGKSKDRSDSETTYNQQQAANPENCEEPASPVPPATPTPAQSTEQHPVEPKKEFKQGILNVVDPFDKTKNLFEGVESTSYDILISAMRDGYQNFQALCEESSKLLTFGQFSTQRIIDEIEKLVKSFFSNTFQRYPFSTDVLEELSGNEEHTGFDALKVNEDDLQVKTLFCTMLSLMF
jgi:hypothetical protein